MLIYHSVNTGIGMTSAAVSSLSNEGLKELGVSPAVARLLSAGLGFGTALMLGSIHNKFWDKYLANNPNVPKQTRTPEMDYDAKGPMFGDDWEDYFKSKYGAGNVYRGTGPYLETRERVLGNIYNSQNIRNNSNFKPYLLNENTVPPKNKNLKLSGKQVELDWLSDNYKAYDVSGNVKVNGKDVNVSRRVYQIDIEADYIPKSPKAKGMTNIELMKKGKAPYIIDSTGKESLVELHHITQKEPSSMVEISEVIHDKNSQTLHGLVEDGGSFRNNPDLEKQYNNFRGNYWKWRANNY